jgi:hypothetical protein
MNARTKCATSFPLLTPATPSLGYLNRLGSAGGHQACPIECEI